MLCILCSMVNLYNKSSNGISEYFLYEIHDSCVSLCCNLILFHHNLLRRVDSDVVKHIWYQSKKMNEAFSCVVRINNFPFF